jgi:hypothetical protein
MTAIALNAAMSTALAIDASRFDSHRNFWKRWSAAFRTPAVHLSQSRGCRRMTDYCR